MANYISLGNWIQLADETYADSRSLMFEKISEHKALHVPAYLLHLAVELYLKAFLMQHDSVLLRTHDLELLFKKCLKIDPLLNNITFQNRAASYDQAYWMREINPYGQDGGVRYLNKNRPVWEFQTLIHDFLEDMINRIKKGIDSKKDITHFL